jgi:protein-disulfide isomerase
MLKRFIIVLLMSFSSLAFAANSFSQKQTQDIQQIVHDYLLAHPEILIQMSQTLQAQQQQSQQQQAQNAITANSAALFNPNHTTVAGNPKGNVTLVEFFDYQCVHCANFQKNGIIKTLIANNPNLRIVYKEFPIFGDASTYASKAAMAATAQGKYLEMRNGIFATGKIEGALRPSDVDAVAKSIGLNMKQYQKDIKDSALSQSINESYTLAQAIGIQGTPSFIVAPTSNSGDSNGKITFIPGLASQSDLQAAIEQAR